MSLSIDQMALSVKYDLEAIGYGSVYISSVRPMVLSPNETLISIRKGSSDYHFMKYHPSGDFWTHKPGGTAVLKYNYQPSNDRIWRGEYIDSSGTAGLSSTTYTSEIYYIVYNWYGIKIENYTVTGYDQNVLSNNAVIAQGVTTIAANAFKNCTGLTNIALPNNLKSIGDFSFEGCINLNEMHIPSSVTHIGKDAFYNTNNIPIYIDSRTSVPSTFDKNWNLAENPVYLNGSLCTHPTTTLISINITLHGQLCDTCRTFTIKRNHLYTTHTPIGVAPSGISMHASTCLCGDTVAVPCVSRLPHMPGDTVTCMYCGQIFTNPTFRITLPNGETFVSSAPFTVTMFEQLVDYLDLSYSFLDFYSSIRTSTVTYEHNTNLATAYINRKEVFHEYCCD